MDIYHIWADKSGDISDSVWVANMKTFLDHLKTEGKMESYRVQDARWVLGLYKICLNGIL
jgi:hypothetical protein